MDSFNGRWIRGFCSSQITKAILGEGAVHPTLIDREINKITIFEEEGNGWNFILYSSIIITISRGFYPEPPCERCPKSNPLSIDIILVLYKSSIMNLCFNDNLCSDVTTGSFAPLANAPAFYLYQA